MEFGEFFLEYPDLFPARCSGAAWGRREVVLDFVGGPYLFSGLADHQVELIEARFGALLVDRNQVDRSRAIETQVFQVADTDFRSFDLNGWNYTVDLRPEPSALSLAGLKFMGRLEWGARLGGAIWSSQEADFQAVFENFFRLLVAYSLLDSGGVLVHSAAVVTHQQAYVFLGRSGAGKSTIAQLALQAGQRVLSDDLNVLSYSPQGALVEKVPFAGSLQPGIARSRAYPLRAVLALEQGPINQIRQMTAAESIARLLSCCPFVNVNQFRRDRLLDNLQRLVLQTHVVGLTFSKDSSFDQILRCVEAGTQPARGAPIG